MKSIVAAIHGILTSQTDPSWPDKFDAWMFERDPEVKVVKKEYRAGPFPRWNCWVRDPLLARSLANELELFLTQPRGKDGFHSVPDLVPHYSAARPLWLVAHSNGAVIALLTARNLIARGHKIGGLILTGAACEADIDRNGVLEWQCRGMLGPAIAYSSAEDSALDGDPSEPFTRHDSPLTNFISRARALLWGQVIWPYGCLGRTGWLMGGKPLSAPDSRFTTHRSPITGLGTRWFSGGHSGYFAPQNIARTFEQIYQDLKAVAA